MYFYMKISRPPSQRLCRKGADGYDELLTRRIFMKMDTDLDRLETLEAAMATGTMSREEIRELARLLTTYQRQGPPTFRQHLKSSEDLSQGFQYGVLAVNLSAALKAFEALPPWVSELARTSPAS